MATASQQSLAADLVRDFAGQQPIRAGSFIITLYGDCIAPRGGSLSLASLLGLMAELGANESLVRTAVSRLAADSWLGGRKLGRRSYYSLTDSGRRRFAEATQRIYSGPPETWDGTWRLVLIPGGAGERRDSLRKELRWLGFGQAAPGVLLHPSADPQAVAEALEQTGAGERAILVSGKSDLPVAGGALKQLVEDSWNFQDITEGYERFLARFRPFADALGGGNALSPLESLQVRLLLVHEFRKVVLRDPMLPLSLLPGDWVGQASRVLCREVYAALLGRSEAWVREHLETEAGPLPEPEAAFWQRFGGLPEPRPSEAL